MYRTIEDIKAEYAKRANEYETMARAWEAVTIKTRKNGQEYATITKACIDGATITTAYDGRKRLHVGDWSTGYISDELDIEFLDDGTTLYKMPPAEVRALIANQIEWLRKQADEKHAALTWLEDNAGKIFDQVESFRATLTEGAPDRGHISWALGEVIGDLIKFNTKRDYWR